MKKFILCSFLSLLAISFIPTDATAGTGLTKTEEFTDSAITKPILLNRLSVIKSMDKSAMTHQEKKALNQETRAIQKSLHDNYGGIYISVGGLLLIIILLILFL